MTARKIVYELTAANFKTSLNGDSGSLATAIPPGSNRSLNGSTESEYYFDPSMGINPFSIVDGNIRITAAPCSPSSNPMQKTYSSGALASYPQFSQAGGRWEMCARFPSGPGFWPAFWLLASTLKYEWENDIGEAWNNDPTHIHETIHGAYLNGWQSPNETPTIPDDTQGFVTFGCEWMPNDITMLVNGTIKNKIPTPTGMIDPGFFIVNLAVGSPGSWVGTPTSGAVGHMDIKYVRVYEPLPGFANRVQKPQNS
jgi:beta-glucanase (GH16 family)